jgi:hypothetical protein
MKKDLLFRKIKNEMELLEQQDSKEPKWDYYR